MFFRIRLDKDGKDEFGRTSHECWQLFARWSIDTVRNNVPDEIALEQLFKFSPSYLACPEDMKNVFAGDAAWNAFLAIDMNFDRFKEFYTPEEIAWAERRVFFGEPH